MYVILGLLSEQPLTGYEMKKIIDLRFRFFWSESYGQLYPELKKMLDMQFIVLDSNTEASRGKQRYKITPAGHEELCHWLYLPPETETLRLEVLLKMYFAKLASPDVMRTHVASFLAAHQLDLLVLKQFKIELERIEDPHHNHGDILRVIDFGIKTNDAYVTWCAETLCYLQGEHDHETQNQ